MKARIFSIAALAAALALMIWRRRKGEA